jgi:limonene-1,2-epoxide hydrolase
VPGTELAVAALFAAIESRDLRAISGALDPSATWQNVPRAPSCGRPAVVRFLGEIVTWSDEVRWDVVTASFGDETAWVERIDRFVIAGAEHAVRCNGVFRVDDGAVVEVRDYVDLGEWRERVTPVLAVMANRPIAAVVHRHLDGVRALDPVRMAADYAFEAVLTRPTGEHRGWASIADYFDTVPARLGRGQLSFGPIVTTGGNEARVTWTLARSDGPPVSGTDTYLVAGGRIRGQRVELDAVDF